LAESDLVIKRKLTYSGVFDFKDFYDMLNGVYSELKYDIDEIDHKAKHTARGLVYNIIWESTKNVDDYTRFKVWMKILTDKMKRVEVEEAGKKKEMFEGDIRMIFKGFLVTDYGGKWEGNPYLVFLKGFFDKYLYGRQGSPALAKGIYHEWVVKLDKDVREIMNETKSFLHVYKA
jgi:hypothetical protein